MVILLVFLPGDSILFEKENSQLKENIAL